MTHEKKFKQQVRARAERTGEAYSSARRALEREAVTLDPPFEPATATREESTGDEARLVAELRGTLEPIQRQIRAREHVEPDAIGRLGTLGHALHVLLAARGREPRHGKYLVQNRRVPVNTIEFYAHIHSAESLVRFLDDPHANDDPPDVTLGHEFEFKVFSRRWGYRDTFHVVRSTSGWNFRFMHTIVAGRDARVNGESRSGLFELLSQETINFPAGLPGYFEHLWERAADGLDHQTVQRALTSLADWISECEQRTPGGVFENY